MSGSALVFGCLVVLCYLGPSGYGPGLSGGELQIMYLYIFFGRMGWSSSCFIFGWLYNTSFFSSWSLVRLALQCCDGDGRCECWL